MMNIKDKHNDISLELTLSVMDTFFDVSRDGENEVKLENLTLFLAIRGKLSLMSKARMLEKLELFK